MNAYNKFTIAVASLVLIAILMVVSGPHKGWESIPAADSATADVQTSPATAGDSTHSDSGNPNVSQSAWVSPSSDVDAERDKQVFHSIYEEEDGANGFGQVQQIGYIQDSNSGETISWSSEPVVPKNDSKKDGPELVAEKAKPTKPAPVPAASPFSNRKPAPPKPKLAELTEFEQALIDQAKANRQAVEAALSFEPTVSSSMAIGDSTTTETPRESSPVQPGNAPQADPNTTAAGNPNSEANKNVPKIPLMDDTGFRNPVLSGQGGQFPFLDRSTKSGNQQVSGNAPISKSEPDAQPIPETPVVNPLDRNFTPIEIVNVGEDGNFLDESSAVPAAVEKSRLAPESRVLGARGNEPRPNLAPAKVEFVPDGQVSSNGYSPKPLASFVPPEKSRSGSNERDGSQDANVAPTQPKRVAKSAEPKKKSRATAKTKPAKEPKAKGDGPTAALKASDFLMAGQPELGAHYKDDTPQRDPRSMGTDANVDDFSPDPVDPYQPYDPGRNMNVYEGKELNANQRPLIEIGRPWYQLGQLPEPSTFLGKHNPITPQFLIFGDYRTAYATSTQNGDSTSQIAKELNTFWHLQVTGTDRFVAGVAPLDNGASNTRYLLDDDDFVEEFDFDFDFGYYEGDLGALIGGFVGETLPFDMPIAIGVMPLLAQNGIWLEDAFLGVAATIPARNSGKFDISNMDITFFAGFDEIISPAFENEDDAAKMWGIMSFIEATNGYWEIDYAYLEDRTNRDRSYHNIGVAFTRRYGRFLSNSTRMIFNAGQSTDAGPNTADGVLLISENSLISGVPSTVVPYFNTWIGFDRPQSAARAGGSGGVLRNTGILFESDGMTGFPTLDASANDTYGAALGINIMPNDFSQQLVLEMAALGTMNSNATRIAQGDQYGVGFRYQLPISNSILIRADGMFGFLRDSDDVHGLRMELRKKF